MTVIKRGNSYWIDIGFNSERFRKRSPENSYRGAKAYELYFRQKLARGQPLEEETNIVKYKFKDFALQWLETYVSNNNKPSEFRIKKYVLNSSLIPFFGKSYIEEIYSLDIERYKSYLLNIKKLSPKSVNNYLSILSRCLKSAVEWNIINNIPRIKILKVPPQKYDFLTVLETERLLQNAEGIWYEMILLAVRTGLRFGELIALKWEDFDLEAGILTVNRNIVRGIEGSPKNNRTRIVPLTKSIISIIKNKPTTCGYFFKNSRGKPLIYNSSRKRLLAICRKAGLREISWHTLRHTFATHLVIKDNSIVSIKELLGHSDIKMTMRYSHVNLPVLKNAINTLEPSFQLNDTTTTQAI
jgi:integrase